MSDDDKSETYPSRMLDKVVIRLPDGMRERLKRSADNLGRSTNSEIVKRLQSSFEDEDAHVVKLYLDSEVWNALFTDSTVRNMSRHERASEIMRTAYLGDGIFTEKSDYVRSFEKIDELYERIVSLEDRNADLREQIEKDFILYFNKVMQVRQLINAMKHEGEGVISDSLASIIEDMERMTDAEEELFEGRYKVVMRRIQMEENRGQDGDEEHENQS